MLKLAQNPCFLHIAGCYKQFCKYGHDRNFFAIRLRMLISVLNNVDIQLILELKNSFGKYHPVFPKNP